MKALCTALLIFLSIQSHAQKFNREQQAVREEVTKTYLEPLYNGGSVDVLQSRLHDEFEMFVYYNGQFSKRSKEQWLDRLRQVRSRPKSPGPKPKNTWEFKMIDITGITAVAKVEIKRGGKLNFTDYLTLYKMNDGWKLLSKFFTSH